MKACCKCHIEQAETEFYIDRHKPAGRRGICKSCMKVYYLGRQGRAKEVKRAYNSTPECRSARQKYKHSPKGKANYERHILKYPDQEKARRFVSHAVQAGKLPRVKTLACCKCGNPAEQYHHHSYARDHWLDVIPVCDRCHKKITVGMAYGVVNQSSSPAAWRTPNSATVLIVCTRSPRRAAFKARAAS